MADRRIVVDPVTRIEGHLRVQAVLGNGGKVITDSQSTGTMWRGLEVILKGRDPRDAWAFVERICGVCTGIHALAAVRSVEDAIGIKIPKNANIIRNLMNATLYTHDHIVHFYQLSALDWVDVVSSLSADPREVSELQKKISPHHPLSSPGYFRDVQNRLKKFVASGQLGIFANGYWGHPAMKLPPAINLLAVTHYLEALDFQREIIKIHTILGGKNPHPNYLVGGVACPINMHDTGAAGNMINEVTMNYMRDIAKQSVEFVQNVYLPDIKAIASFITPILASWAAVRFGDWKLVFPIFAAFSILATLLLWGTKVPETAVDRKSAGFIQCLKLLGDGTVLLLFFGIVAHVGIDVGVNTCAPKIIMERTGLPLETAGKATSVYFLFRTIGCLSGSFILSRWKDSRFFALSVGLMVLSMLGLAFLNSEIGIYVSLALVGFGNSNVFSIIFSRALLSRPDKTNEVSGLMIMGLIGGSVFPLLMGILSDALQSQIGSVIVISVGVVYLIALSRILLKKNA